MNLTDIFSNCTCITRVPEEFFVGVENIKPIKTPYIDALIKSKANDYGFNKKHRCPNCGATKIIINDCEYCGT